MAGNRTELNIVVVAGAQNGVVPQVNVVAVDDVQNVVVPQADAPASCGIQNILAPQVDAPIVGIQNADVPQVDVIAAGDQNGVVSRVDQNDTVQQAGADVEPTESSDDDEMYEVEDQLRGKKTKYQRHTQEQYNELENFFVKHPHPTEKQRIELGMKIGMEMQKIKYWFKNRRTRMKIQIERHENILLKKQNDKLIAENAVLRKNVTNPRCTSYGGDPVVPTPLAFENEHLRAEVARLNEEVSRLNEEVSRLNKEVARLNEEVARLRALANRYN
ncbi:Homeobox-leucine zipper protein ROC6 [Linum perenne]